jgi:RNA polymerase sigma-70 factor, ECF subfamily
LSGVIKVMDHTAQKITYQMPLLRSSISKPRSNATPFDFEAAFDQYWAPLCRMLYQLTGDPDEAEDLALETMLQLYRQPPTDPSNLSGWLYRVGTNLGLNALRARKRRQRYESETSHLDIQATSLEDPATSSEQRMEQERVRTALQAIKPRSMQILLLRHSGLSYAEIATALEVAPGSIGTLLVRAEQEFQRALEELPG